MQSARLALRYALRRNPKSTVRRISYRAYQTVPAVATSYSHQTSAESTCIPHALLATALATAAVYPTYCKAEAQPKTRRWPQVLVALRNAQHLHNLPTPLLADRQQHSKAPFWSFKLDMPANPGADLYTALVTLASTFGSEHAPTVHIDESPTRTELRLCGGEFEVCVSVPRLSPFETRVEIEVLREGADAEFTNEEVDALVRVYAMLQSNVLSAHFRMSSPMLDGKDSVEIGPPTTMDRSMGRRGSPFEQFEGGIGSDSMSVKRARAKLEELGVEVFDGKGSGLTWDALAGYDEVKKTIENTLTLPLKHPDVYDKIVRGTRERYESNLPKAVLYEGPPGCGKTMSARILAALIGVPFVHVPLETILSKFYGETTRKLAEILQTANELGRCLVFIDECDSIGLSRSSSTEIHEVTRRTLSVLLRHIDGIDGPQNTILLAATNHKEDIDPALMSRFDVVVSFPLPDLDTRAAILALYAKHLSQEELKAIAEMSDGFSGRELLDVCEEAERTYAGHLVRESVSGAKRDKGEGQKLPRLSEYMDAIKRKAPHIVGGNPKNGGRRRESSGTLMTVGPAPSLAM